MAENQELRTGRYVVSQLHAHLVFIPRYRHGIFDADALQKLRKSFDIVCAAFEAKLKAFNGAADHVHLVVEYPPKVALSNLVNSLKGVSARKLRSQRPDIAQRYWRGGLWSASYFVASCGGGPMTVLRQYIEGQRAPH
jgi:putative transposase